MKTNILHLASELGFIDIITEILEKNNSPQKIDLFSTNSDMQTPKSLAYKALII